LWLLGRKALHGQLGTVRDAHGAENAIQMTLHGTFGQPENVGYLPVCGSKFEHRDDLILTPGQSLADVHFGGNWQLG